MANETKPQSEPRALTIDDLETVGAVMGKAVANGINETQRRKVTIGEYMQRPGSPFSTRRPRLKRETYQNGYRLTSLNLTDEQIQLCNKLTHSGRYLNRIVTVVLTDNGAGEEELNIRWNCKNVNQRMDAKGVFKDFTDLLQQLVALQKEEDELEEARKHPPRQHFGAKSQAAQKALETA